MKSSNNPLRQEIARRACYEVQQLANMLREYIEKNDSSGQDAPAMRSGLMRLSDLSDIIYEAAITDEPSETDAELVEMFGGHLALGKFAEGDAA